MLVKPVKFDLIKPVHVSYVQRTGVYHLPRAIPAPYVLVKEGEEGGGGFRLIQPSWMHTAEMYVMS